jgi:rifampicin phosphotransferase
MPTTQPLGSSLPTGTKLLLTWPIRIAARRPMLARERIRWQAMTAFAQLRTRLLDLAREAVETGLLPDREAVFDLSVDELAAIDHGQPFSAADLALRRREIAARAELRLPDIIHRFDDLTRLQATTVSDDHLVYKGVSLTNGTVYGTALRCDEPPDGLPPGFDPGTTVLIARSVDAGWVPIFAQVAGVAVEIGGDLSHGSIILRELGVPAATNMGPMTNVVTGDRVRLDAATGTLSIVRTSDDETQRARYS